MKRIILILGLVWTLLPTQLHAGYNDVQQQSVTKDTTTISNQWDFRGDFAWGASTYVVLAADIPKYVRVLATGTVECIDLRATNIYGTVAPGCVDHSAVSSSGTLTHAQLDSQIASSTTSIYNLGQATGTLRTDVYNLQQSTFSVGSIDHNLIQSTGTKTHLQLESLISGATTSIYTLGQDTGTLVSSVNDKVGKTDSFGGDVTGAYNATVVGKVGGVQFDTSTWTDTQFLKFSGGKVISAESGGLGSGLTKTFTQTAHGFSIGNVIKYTSGGGFAKAKADTSANAEVVGIVSSTPTVDTFTLSMSGWTEGLSGLTAGTLYYLSDSSEGALTSTEPTTYGSVSKPLFLSSGTTNGWFNNYRGIVVNSGTSVLNSTNTWTAQQTVQGKFIASRQSYVHAFLKTALNNLTDTVATKVVIDSKTVDSLSEFNVAYGSFTATYAGVYYVSFWGLFTDIVDGKIHRLEIYKNGVGIVISDMLPRAVHAQATSRCSKLIKLSAGDVLTFYATVNVGVNTVDLYGDTQDIYTAVDIMRMIDYE